jgi:hypothetical protein
VLFELGAGVPMDAAALCEKLKSLGVLMLPTGARKVRAVTHLDVDHACVLAAADAVADVVRAE